MNESVAKPLMSLLLKLNMPQETIVAIPAILETDENAVKMAHFIQANQSATESELLKEAQRIANEY